MRVIFALVLIQGLFWFNFLQEIAPKVDSTHEEVSSYRFFADVPLTPLELTPLEDLRDTRSASVKLYLYRTGGMVSYYQSTGFVVGQNQDNAYILSTAHFCELVQQVQHPKVQLLASGFVEAQEASIVYWDSARDLCLLESDWFGVSLRLAPQGFRPNAGDRLGVAQPFHQLRGHSLIYSAISPQRVRSSSKERAFVRPLMGLAMNVKRGQSGSPVLDRKGLVVGLLFGAVGTKVGVVLHVDEIYDFIADFNHRLAS